jgi:hypothetical protein
MTKQGSIDYFLNSKKTNLLRTNRYIANIFYKSKSIDHILCESIELPENGINTTAYQIGNRPQFLIPYSKNYGANTINITIRENITEDKKPEILLFMENWSNDIISKDTANLKYEISYYRDILGQIDFSGLDIDNNKIIDFKIYNVYPTMIKPSTYEYNDINSYVKLTITMAFEEFEIM